MKRKTPPELAAEEEITEGTGTTTSTENKEPMGTWSSSSEGSSSSHILKLKEAFASDRLWREMRDTPGGMRRWLAAREDAAKAEEAQPPLSKRRKKKVVVKTLMAPEFMEALRARGPPRTVSDMSAAMLSRRTASFRREYAIRKYIDGRWGDYLGALVDQYERLGYAEDEDEITDDEDDDVVKMESLAIH